MEWRTGENFPRINAYIGTWKCVSWPLFWSLIPSFSTSFFCVVVAAALYPLLWVNIYSIHDMFLFYRCLAYTCNIYTDTTHAFYMSGVKYVFLLLAFFSFSSTSFPSSLFFIIIIVIFPCFIYKILGTLVYSWCDHHHIWAAFSMCNSSIYFSCIPHTHVSVYSGTTCYIFLLQFLLSVFLLYFLCFLDL